MNLYFCCGATAGQREAMGTPPAAQKSLTTWMAWIRKLETNGNLKNRGIPLGRTGKVLSGTPPVIVDGLYAEAKDMVLGFLVIDARDMDHAVQIAGGCPIAQGGGAVEIRPVTPLNI
ncbi:MAG: YciI family protein [Gemmatimonadaceae bacterium]